MSNPRQEAVGGFTGQRDGMGRDPAENTGFRLFDTDATLDLNRYRRALVANSEATANAAKSTISLTKVLVGFATAAKAAQLAAAIFQQFQESAARQRLSNRGDFNTLIRRRLQGTANENIVSSIPPFGFVKKINERARENAGLGDLANAADRLATAFDSNRASIDQYGVSLASAQLSNKYAFNPEANAFQQRMLQIKSTIGAKIEGLTGTRNLFRDAVSSGLIANEKVGRELENEPGGSFEGAGRRLQLIEKRKAIRFQLNKDTELSEAFDQEGGAQLNVLLKQRAGLKAANRKKFVLDQQKGSSAVSVDSFAAVGVAGALDAAPKEDPIIQAFSSTNTLLSDIKIILWGRLPRAEDAGKGQ